MAGTRYEVPVLLQNLKGTLRAPESPSAQRAEQLHTVIQLCREWIKNMGLEGSTCEHHRICAMGGRDGNIGEQQLQFP
jgi:hypothetical protein